LKSVETIQPTPSYIFRSSSMSSSSPHAAVALPTAAPPTSTNDVNMAVSMESLDAQSVTPSSSPAMSTGSANKQQTVLFIRNDSESSQPMADCPQSKQQQQNISLSIPVPDATASERKGDQGWTIAANVVPDATGGWNIAVVNETADGRRSAVTASPHGSRSGDRQDARRQARYSPDGPRDYTRKHFAHESTLYVGNLNGNVKERHLETVRLLMFFSLSLNISMWP
jgi:hypothetical protein